MRPQCPTGVSEGTITPTERLWSSSPKQYAIVSGSSAHSADPTFTASLLVRAADRRHDAPGAATPQAGTAADPGLVRRRVATRSAPTEQFGVGICHWPRGPPCAVRRSTGTGRHSSELAVESKTICATEICADQSECRNLVHRCGRVVHRLSAGKLFKSLLSTLLSRGPPGRGVCPQVLLPLE